MESPSHRGWWQREWWMAALALLVLPALVLEESRDPQVRAIASTLNWMIWLAFVADFLIGLARARARRAYIRSAWFDIAVIVLSPPFGVPDAWQPLRAARVMRLFRVLRGVGIALVAMRRLRGFMMRSQFHWVALVTCALVLVGALAEFEVERRHLPSENSFSDSLWWAVVTATTVGYGDISPRTTAGRIVAVGVMVTGIGFISVFTATIAGYFLHSDSPSDLARVEERLDAIDRKLDDVMRRLENRTGSEEAPGQTKITPAAQQR